MTVFSNNQGEIDAATSAIDTALTVIAGLGAELQALKAQEGASQLDFTALDAKVAELNAKVTAASVSAPVVDVSALQVAGNTGAAPSLPATVDEPAAVSDTGTEPAEATTGGGQHAAPDDGPESKPLYKHIGTDPIDATAWPAADLTAADDGAQLYTYSGDTPGGEPAGASAEWQVYTGPTAGSVEAEEPASTGSTPTA